MIKVVKNKDGKILYRQIPDFEDGAGIKNATILFGEGKYTEEYVEEKEMAAVAMVSIPEKALVISADFDNAKTIEELKTALKPLLGLGGK